MPQNASGHLLVIRGARGAAWPGFSVRGAVVAVAIAFTTAAVH